MKNDELEELLGVLKKMSDLQIHTLTKVTRLQAQVLVQQSLIETILREQGAEPDSLHRQISELAKRNDDELLDSLKDWLVQNDMALPMPDDPWWDKPRS